MPLSFSPVCTVLPGKLEIRKLTFLVSVKNDLVVRTLSFHREGQRERGREEKWKERKGKERSEGGREERK